MLLVEQQYDSISFDYRYYGDDEMGSTFSKKGHFKNSYRML